MIQTHSQASPAVAMESVTYCRRVRSADQPKSNISPTIPVARKTQEVRSGLLWYQRLNMSRKGTRAIPAIERTAARGGRHLLLYFAGPPHAEVAELADALG